MRTPRRLLVLAPGFGSVHLHLLWPFEEWTYRWKNLCLSFCLQLYISNKNKINIKKKETSKGPKIFCCCFLFWSSISTSILWCLSYYLACPRSAIEQKRALLLQRKTHCVNLKFLNPDQSCQPECAYEVLKILYNTDLGGVNVGEIDCISLRDLKCWRKNLKIPKNLKLRLSPDSMYQYLFP